MMDSTADAHAGALLSSPLSLGPCPSPLSPKPTGAHAGCVPQPHSLSLDSHLSQGISTMYANSVWNADFVNEWQDTE